MVKRPSLRRSLLSDMLVLVIGVTLVVGWVTYHQFRRASVSLVGDHLQEIAGHAETKLEGFIEPTRSTAEVARQLAAEEVIGLHDRTHLRALFAAYLQSQPNIQNVYFGDPEGNFVMVERRPDGALREKRVVVRQVDEVEGQPPTVLFKQFDLEAGPFRGLLVDLARAAREHTDRDALHARLRELATAYPFAQQLLVARPQGQLSLLERAEEGLIGKERTRTEESLDVGEGWSEAQALDAPYELTQRPWYQAGVQSPGEVVWTDVYRFFDGRLGVTAAWGIPGPAGVQAVVGFDLAFEVYTEESLGAGAPATLAATFYSRLGADGQWAPAAGRQGFFDCRTRPWYEEVRARTEPRITDVYLFTESQLPGVSVSVAARRGERLVGVVGVDVNLRSLSEFVLETSQGLRGEDSLAFILDDDLRLIGFPTDSFEDLRSPVDRGSLRRLGEVEGLRGVDVQAVASAQSHPDPRVAARWEVEGRAYLAERTRFEHVLGGSPWNLWVVVPEDVFMGPVRRNMIYAVGISILAALLAVGLSARLRSRVAEPLEALARGFKTVRAGEYFEVAVEGDPNYREIQTVRKGFEDMLGGLQERHHLLRYVSGATLEAVAKRAREVEHALGGVRERRTLWFSDIRGFTAFSEKRTPEEVIDMLNTFLAVQAEILEAHGGDIDKFVGDEIMCLFSGDDAEQRALTASFEILRALEVKRCEEGVEIAVGIGINAGEVVVGNVGAAGRMDFTVIGDAVNFAARLCSGAEPGDVLISGEVARATPDADLERVEGFVAKGKSGDLEVYRVTHYAPS